MAVLGVTLTGGVPLLDLQYIWYMYTVLIFRPEYQYPLYFHIFLNAHPAAAYCHNLQGRKNWLQEIPVLRYNVGVSICTVVTSPCIRRVRVRVLRFCARVKARFSSTGFRFKKLFLKHYNPYTQFAPFLFSPSRITDKRKSDSLQRY